MPNPNEISRRTFIATTATAVAGLWLPRDSAAEPPRKTRTNFGNKVPLSFFVIGDTHYLANKNDPAKLDAQAIAYTTGLINALNRLPGTEIPEAAGGGTVIAPRGVIHVGDLIDSGDKNGGDYPKMHQTEWDGFIADFGLTGKDGRLKFPVCELHGNHDSPHGEGVVTQAIIQRNKKRPGIANVSKNGLHYSWDWDGVHFINLGIVVGEVTDVTRQRRYNAMASLDFLVSDLKSKVGKSGRPVVVSHHVDIARNAKPCAAAAPPDLSEWDACDVAAFYDALKPHNVIAIFYGHTHARNMLKWDGASTRAAQGIDIFNVTQASHYSTPAHGIFYVQITEGDLLVREYQTTDGWQTAAWTPQVWRVPINASRNGKTS